MSEPTALKTCKEIRFPAPPEMEGWFYAGNFGTGLRDTADLKALLKFLTAQFGSHAYHLLRRANEETGKTRDYYLLLAPVQDIADFALGHLQVAARGEPIDDELFWDMVTPILQRMWDAASLSERIQLVREAGAPASAVMEADVPDDVHTILYQGLDTL